MTLEPGCTKVSHRLGRCYKHFASLPLPERERLRGMSWPERVVEYQKIKASSPEPSQKWEWPGREDELAALAEQQEREKKSGEEPRE